jgi:hypothetical protein
MESLSCVNLDPRPETDRPFWGWRAVVGGMTKLRQSQTSPLFGQGSAGSMQRGRPVRLSPNTELALRPGSDRAVLVSAGPLRQSSVLEREDILASEGASECDPRCADVGVQENWRNSLN